MMQQAKQIFHPSVRCYSQKDSRGKSAFTLIELLVVITIISLLVSILVPSLQRAKELAMSVACASNLHGVGIAMELYKADYDGYYVPVVTDNAYFTWNAGMWPPMGRWFNLLERYTQTYDVFNCPVRNKITPDFQVQNVNGALPPQWNPAWGALPRGAAGYGVLCNYRYNYANVGGCSTVKTGPYRLKRYEDIEKLVDSSGCSQSTDQVVAVTEGVFCVMAAGDYGNPYTTNYYDLFHADTFIHMDRANCLFLQGNVSAQTQEDMLPSASMGWGGTEPYYLIVGKP